ncbi:MAG: S41 family peptidase, partial [Henriciella sp.]
GSVQTVVPLGGGRGAIRLTTARYYTPSGRSIQGTGISPDVEVSSVRLTEEQIARIGRYSEANLMNALGNENGTDREVPHLPDEQPQLDKAIEYIKAERALAGYRPHNG